MKKRKRLYQKVAMYKRTMNKTLYSILLGFALFLEVLRRTLKYIFIILSVCISIGTVVGLIKFVPLYNEYNQYATNVVNNSSIDDFQINESSTIYDSNKKVIAVLKDGADLHYISYDKIPKDVVNAFIAIEDRTFWDNDGYDPKGIVRVGINYIISRGQVKNGASTITQQLARSIYLNREIKLERKFKEILISKKLTEKYSKKQIMEFYVNDVCFANGIYGIAGASKAYFNKNVNKLSLSEIAYLCAIPNSPTYYDPYVDYTRALKRRDKILNDMVECGFITQKQCDKAISENIKIKHPKDIFNDYQTTFAMDCAVKYLMKIDGFKFKYQFDSQSSYDSYHKKYNKLYSEYENKLKTGGYKIYTTLNLKTYKKLQKILNKNLTIDNTKDKNGIYKLQGAMTCIDNKTGKVIAVVGGRKQSNKTYSLNRAYQSYRQPGSSIKPLIVYTPALEKLNYNANTTVYDINVNTAKLGNVNVQKMYGQSMTLRYAVEHSRNGVAWQTFDKLTPKVGLKYITNMRYSNICPDDYYNSSSLGGFTNGVTTVEQASGYAALANHGTFKEPTCIKSIKDKNGKEIFKNYKKKDVYSDKAADDMVDILKGVLTNGTASGLYWSSSSKTEAFAKTGTTNLSKDGWFCGSTPYYSIAVWVGYDFPKPLNSLYGSTYPGQIWKQSMLELIKNKPIASFDRNEKDKSYSVSSKSKGYYSYLPGRSDSEILSSGYTVADYRKDRVIGESIQKIIDELNTCDNDKIDELYNKGMNLVNSIYSVKYTAEMKNKLQSAYNQKK